VRQPTYEKDSGGITGSPKPLFALLGKFLWKLPQSVARKLAD